MNDDKLFDDPRWQRASAWLSGEANPAPATKLAVFGIPMNTSITPGRCDLAPNAIRQALRKYGTFDFVHNSDLREVCVKDEGDIPLDHLDAEGAVDPVRNAVRPVVDEGTPVILLGGDNGVTRPGVLAVSSNLARTGLLTLDAHFDLRDLDQGLHNGNPVRALLRDGLQGNNIVQIGIQPFVNSAEYTQVARDAGINFFSAEQVFAEGVERIMRSAFDYLRDVDVIYFSLDMDVLDRIHAPACPGSRPGGILPWQLHEMCYICGAHFNICAMDIVEIDPTKDIADVTVMAAAAALLSFASGTFERRTVK